MCVCCNDLRLKRREREKVYNIIISRVKKEERKESESDMITTQASLSVAKECTEKQKQQQYNEASNK